MHFDLPSLEKYLGEFLNLETSKEKPLKNLETMAILCTHFNHPEHFCPCFHVAGSKGKGTIANSIAAILREKGYSTGVYSSPHVYHFTERFSTGAGAFDKKIYQKAEKELKAGINFLITSNAIKKTDLSWPIILTIFAMLAFREAKVDYAVYEVGIGGRLDPTNIVNPLSIAIGLIELEHTRLLGNSLSEIATEKAGVFKPYIPIVSISQEKIVKNTLDHYAAKNHTTIEYIEESDYQLADAKVAARCVQSSFLDLDEKLAISTALKASLPGRYELIKNYQGLPYLLMDGAHTQKSIQKVLARMQKDHVHGNLIFACAADKNVEKMAEEIISSDLFTTIYLTRPGDFKKSDLARTEKAFKNASVKVYSDSNFQSLIKKALDDSRRTNMPCIVLGSLYLPSEVKKIS